MYLSSQNIYQKSKKAGWRSLLLANYEKEWKAGSTTKKSCGMPHSPYLLIVIFPHHGSPPFRKILCRSPGSQLIIYSYLPGRSSGSPYDECYINTAYSGGTAQAFTCFPLSPRQMPQEHKIIFNYNIIIYSANI